MNKIPSDAVHWDSGDWIEWHRNAEQPVNPPCSAPSGDPIARLHTLQLRMLQCARAYFELTGEHLPIYQSIAKVHATLAFDFSPSQLHGSATQQAAPQVIAIPPDGSHAKISVDLSEPFAFLIVVRIKTDFTAEGRLMPRASLPDQKDGTVDISWRDLPTSS